jgi:plasmid stability protein
MARKPTAIVGVKLRMRESLRRQIEKLATKHGHSVNQETIRLLESAVLAEQVGLGGIDGVIKAVQSSSAAFAVQETIKQLGLDKPVENQSQPSVTKRSPQ